MCGIIGVAGINESHPAQAACRTLMHRGPDDGDVRFFSEASLALGHRRLSIIDLSPLGRQPMANEEQTVWISFNGEIYNFAELKKQLDSSRHTFASETDTEVILHLYEERGTEAFRLLNGMFAFALYDARIARLFLVRDHAGIKPLYYAQIGDKLVFGSEIKSILASGLYTPEINWQSVHDFFTYLYIPSPGTMFRGIWQLPAAHWMEYDLKARRIASINSYWNVAAWGTEKPTETDEAQLQVKLRARMSETIRQQMVSDVPLGAFLSGGVDSNVIVGLMAEHSSRPVKTFTVLFEGPEMDYYDERTDARRIARKFGTEHYELPIDLSEPEEMLDLVEYFDQPFGNTTFYITQLLSKLTRQHVTVALSGAGGDELFGGYPRYQAVQAARYLRYVPRLAARAAYGAISQLNDTYADRRLHRVRALLDGLDSDPAQQYMKWVYFLNEERKAQLLVQRNEGLLSSHRILQEHLNEIPESWDQGNQFSYLDVRTFLADNLLEYSDKMSMAESLELRVPYLDPRLIELAFRIPFSMKLRRGESKSILRRTFADLIPEENRRMPKKGFNVPLGMWMRTRLDRFFDERLPRDYVEREGIFNHDYIRQLREEHCQGKRDNSYELFAILIFDTWYRKYITQTLPMIHQRQETVG
jgi:asparagine synthase (glutamine-hydrolysing)